MARKIFILGIFVLAAGLGIFGYQALTLYFYRGWPSVSLGFGWQTLHEDIWQPFFGDFWRPISGEFSQFNSPDLVNAVNWVGRVPLAVAGIVLSYLLFLLSDALRGRADRRRA